MVMDEFHEFEHLLLCILRYKSVTFLMECLLVRIALAFMLTISKRKIAFTYIFMYKLKKAL
jgi:hypothetical protein